MGRGFNCGSDLLAFSTVVLRRRRETQRRGRWRRARSNASGRGASARLLEATNATPNVGRRDLAKPWQEGPPLHLLGEGVPLSRLLTDSHLLCTPVCTPARGAASAWQAFQVLK